MAKELENLNPHWSDIRIFVEARRIVVAKLQVITYREYLPLLIGRTKMDEFKLTLLNGESDFATERDVLNNRNWPNEMQLDLL